MECPRAAVVVGSCDTVLVGDMTFVEVDAVVVLVGGDDAHLGD